MIQVPQCFKNTDNHKAIELMLTNSVPNFQNSCALETGLYDFDKMTVTVFKSYQKKNITSDLIGTWEHSQTMILEQILQDSPTLHLNSDYSSSDLCIDICIRALDIYALRKRKYFKVNNSSFINIAISKAKLDCTRLRKTFLKNKSAEN